MERNRPWVLISEVVAALKKLPRDTHIPQEDLNDMLIEIAEEKEGGTQK